MPECDDYMKKYLACIDKLAPSAQAQARQALDQSREAWKQAASTEVGKSALASTCKTASDTAAPAMRAQGMHLVTPTTTSLELYESAARVRCTS